MGKVDYRFPLAILYQGKRFKNHEYGKSSRLNVRCTDLGTFAFYDPD